MPRTPAAPGAPASVPRREAKACPAESLPGMACVSGGWFARGSDQAQPDERPRAEIFVETFLLDVHEVTNARYAPCIESKRCKRPRPFEGYLEPRQPVVAVSWFDALAFCEGESKRLPTEAEFERAASGPNGATYAWGDEPLACKATVIETTQGKGCGRGTTWPVGSRPVGHFGLFDMSGNVWEWVADWYSPCYAGCDGACGTDCLGENPLGPCAGKPDCAGHTQRGVRGGSWWYPLERARASARRGSEPANLGPHRFGFRCARDL
jgi:formylglycine-generating enzyme